MSKPGSALEMLVLDDFKKFDRYARPTINSGAVRNDGDIASSYFCIDTKDKTSNTNFIATVHEMKKLKGDTARSGAPYSALIVANKNQDMVVVMPYAHFLSIARILTEHDQD